MRPDPGFLALSMMGNPKLKPVDPFRFVPIALAGWMNQLQVIDYLREENRVLREQLGGRRPVFER